MKDWKQIEKKTTKFIYFLSEPGKKDLKIL